jgi:glycosyltransferase involved in cell wall biosynthesis
MRIAIDASRAFLHERTGIEEYSYQLIKHLRTYLENEEVILYLRKGTVENIDFNLPPSWTFKELGSWRWWTYWRLSLEILFHWPDRLLISSHIVPPIHPKNTTTVVHGIEYEICPEAYSKHEYRAMRQGIRNSCKWAKRVICCSNNTKQDLIKYYKVPESKMRVIYEGVNAVVESESHYDTILLQRNGLERGQYIFFVSRLEERKNVVNIIKAFEILKTHFRVAHKLVLAGKPGYGWDLVEQELEECDFRDDIILPGFVTEQEKWAFLRNASVFAFPTLYEGFGLPVLEAQQVGTPVVTSNHSSLQEVAQESALLADPYVPAEIAEKIHILMTDNKVREEIIQKGLENIKRFSWDRCAKLMAKVVRMG